MIQNVLVLITASLAFRWGFQDVTEKSLGQALSSNVCFNTSGVHGRIMVDVAMHRCHDATFASDIWMIFPQKSAT